jgi:hypothetical protein
MTKSSNTAAIERATGIAWSDWMEHLDELGGRTLPHRDLAKHAYTRLADLEGNMGWWAQGVAVAYEQEIGRREPGQSCDGAFQVGVSKTYRGTMDDALAAWSDLVGGLEEFGGVPVDKEPTTSATEKWRYWRVPLADGSRVSLDICDSAPGKSRMGINHTKLDSPAAAEHWRSAWKEIFARL